MPAKPVKSQKGQPAQTPEMIRALLADAKAKKAELLEQAAKYRETHQLEQFQPHARQQLFFDALRDPAISTYVLLGGNRCLAPDERIFNPLTGDSTPIKDLSHQPHHVLAWDSKKGRLVPALALPSFPKGEDQMFMVTLSNGQQFEASGGHLILTPDGYRPVSELRPQSAVFTPPPREAPSRAVEDCMVQSIEPTRRAERWDFHVPRLNNYFHQGIIHHNSGKTECAATAAISLALGRCPWVPIPTPVDLPQALKTQMHPDGTVTVYFTDEVLPALEARGLSEGWTPAVLKASPDAFLYGQAPKKLKTTPAICRTFQTDKEYREVFKLLTNPPDPGKLRFDPPVKIRLLAEDMTALEQVQIPKLRKYVAPEWVIAKKKNSFGVETHWIFQNGSVIDLLTYQQDSAMMEGWDGHVCVYDEPPPRSHYIANIRGLVDHAGISIFSMTPLKEAWIADEIVNKPDNTIWTLTMHSRENPHVSKSALDEFESKLTEEEKETRLGGKFLHLQGLVFKEFDKAKHVINPFDIPPNYTCYASVDTHPRTEQAVAFMAVDPRGNQFVVSESFRHETPDQVADRLIDFHKNTHPLEVVLIEPSSQGDTNRGESTFTIIENRLLEAGITLELGSKDLSGGIQIMRDALRSKNGLASLFFFRNCERTVWEMQRYVWQDWKNAGGKDKTEMNKPKDADDHLIECIRRLIQYPAAYVPPRAQSEYLDRTWKPTDPDAGY